MANLAKMQRKVDKMISVFTNIVNELDCCIAELNDSISTNEHIIECAKTQNSIMSNKIVEYEKLKSNIQRIVE